MSEGIRCIEYLVLLCIVLQLFVVCGTVRKFRVFNTSRLSYI